MRNRYTKQSWIVVLAFRIAFAGLLVGGVVGFISSDGNLRYFGWMPFLYILVGAIGLAIFVGILGSIHEAILKNEVILTRILEEQKNTGVQVPDNYVSDVRRVGLHGSREE